MALSLQLSTRNYLLVSANRPKVYVPLSSLRDICLRREWLSLPFATIMQRSIYLCRSKGEKGRAIRFARVFSPIPCAVHGVHYVHSLHSCVRCGAVHFINVPKCILPRRLTSWNMRHAGGLKANNGQQTIKVLFLLQ